MRIAPDVFWIAFATNFAWEMLQMFAYQGLPRPRAMLLLICGLASLADALYTTLVYGMGRWRTREGDWIRRLTPRRLFWICLAGFVSATIAEKGGLLLGMWRYSRSMVVIPLLQVGLLPILQLMLLPLLVFRLVGGLAVRHTALSGRGRR